MHPFNPEGYDSAPWDVSFNTAASFVSNTNWQYYGGETTLSYFSQMTGLAVQNFISATVGMAVVVAVIRGFAARSVTSLGDPWSISPARCSTSCCRFAHRRAVARPPRGRCRRWPPT